MSTAKHNKATAQRFLALLEAEDIEGLVGLFAPHGRQVNPYASGLFPAGAEGREGLRAYWAPVPGNFDGMRFVIDELFASEDGQTVFARFQGELGLKDGAGVYANDYYSLFRFDESGQITEYVEIFNPVVAARGFGRLDQLVGGTDA